MMACCRSARRPCARIWGMAAARVLATGGPLQDVVRALQCCAALHRPRSRPGPTSPRAERSPEPTEGINRPTPRTRARGGKAVWLYLLRHARHRHLHRARGDVFEVAPELPRRLRRVPALNDLAPARPAAPGGLLEPGAALLGL